MVSRRDLLLEICNCPNVKEARADSDHPCAEVVRSQQAAALNDFQSPAPWVGQVHSAPILFVSSNPSISDTEHHPTWRKSTDFKVDYFERHFGGGAQPWTRDGTRTLQLDGSYSRAIRFYSGIKQRAAELLEREPEPGIDYALTWVVRCKSLKGIGVDSAVAECSSRYLLQTVRAARARLIVVFGRPARDAVGDVFGALTGSAHMDGPRKAGRYERWFAHLAHPSALGRATREKRFSDRFSSAEIEHLRSLVA